MHGAPKAAAATPWTRPEDVVRVLSYNVLAASPLLHPEPFGRVLRALEPDILLIQEWEGADAAELVRWLQWVMPGRPWDVRQSAGRGVAVAARHPLERWGPFRLRLPGDVVAGLPSPYFGELVGFVAAEVQTPLAPVVAAAVHLTACGEVDSIEDRRRQAEAERIAAVLCGRSHGDIGGLAHLALQPPAPDPRPWHEPSPPRKDIPWSAAPGSHRPRSPRVLALPPAMLVVAGDLNLVGSRRPLETLAAGIDRDGRDLQIAQPEVLGTQDRYTWRDDRTPYQPGSLDWLLYSGSSAQARQTFVFDTARLPSDLLAAHDLRPEDTAFSDHLPLVADLSPR